MLLLLIMLKWNTYYYVNLMIRISIHLITYYRQSIDYRSSSSSLPSSSCSSSAAPALLGFVTPPNNRSTAQCPVLCVGCTFIFDFFHTLYTYRDILSISLYSLSVYATCVILLSWCVCMYTHSYTNGLYIWYLYSSSLNRHCLSPSIKKIIDKNFIS